MQIDSLAFRACFLSLTLTLVYTSRKVSTLRRNEKIYSVSSFHSFSFFLSFIRSQADGTLLWSLTGEGGYGCSFLFFAKTSSSSSRLFVRKQNKKKFFLCRALHWCVDPLYTHSPIRQNITNSWLVFYITLVVPHRLYHDRTHTHKFRFWVEERRSIQAILMEATWQIFPDCERQRSRSHFRRCKNKLQSAL